ncbi:MAG: DUF2652 domain-containing protein [Actinomycetota bacterium]|nr:DUF2652 domain-containing protein [Actinomycetota bacterium]
MRGLLIIADISGYTRFLTEAELDHAHGIVTELLNAIISAIQAPFKVSSIEGDAVFMYGELPEDVFGQVVLESVESLYTAFAGALETMVLNTTCSCNACANINTLGLKIVMHCGEFVKTIVGDRETLAGPEVIAVHRLLKNRVTETTGIADYLLVTQACVDELDLTRIVAPWIEHTESYEHIGEVRGYVSSLAEVWAFARRQSSNLVSEGEAWVTARGFSVAPPPIVWDYLIDPRKRTRWMQVEGNVVEGEVDGRVGAGSEYHCAHGGGEISVFSVLDSRPNEYITLTTPFTPGTALRYTHYLIPSGTGTRLVTYAVAPTSADTGETVPELSGSHTAEVVLAIMQEPLDRLVGLADDAASRLPATNRRRSLVDVPQSSVPEKGGGPR